VPRGPRVRSYAAAADPAHIPLGNHKTHFLHVRFTCAISALHHSVALPQHTDLSVLQIVFTARRYSIAVYAVILCLSVCPSVTSLRITQTTLCDSPGLLKFSEA